MKSTNNLTSEATAGRLAEGGLLARVAGLAAQRLEAWRNRHALAELLSFDDRQLADIGITRGDIEWALSQPFSSDVSAALDRVRNGRSL